MYTIINAYNAHVKYLSLNSGSYIIDGAISSQNSIAFNPKNGDVAYIAGAFVVIYSMKTSK